MMVNDDKMMVVSLGFSIDRALRIDGSHGSSGWDSKNGEALLVDGLFSK